MSEKTDSKRWLPWAVSLAIVVAIVVLTREIGWYRYMLTPWQLATGVSIDVGISQYNLDKIDPGEFSSNRFEAMARMILLLIVGPAFWIIGEIRSQRKESEDAKGLIWFLGTVLVLLGLFTGIAGSYFTLETYKNAKTNFAKNSKSAEMGSRLQHVAFDLYEYFHLPKKYGGGGGSFEAFAEKGESALKQLESYEKTNAFDFVIGDVNPDSSITLFIVRDARGVNPDFENINGKKGYMQERISVHPTYDAVEFDYQKQNVH